MIVQNYFKITYNWCGTKIEDTDFDKNDYDEAIARYQFLKNQQDIKNLKIYIVNISEQELSENELIL